MNNLLTNCVRHNAPDCAIRLGVKSEEKYLMILVEGGTWVGPVRAEAAQALELSLSRKNRQ